MLFLCILNDIFFYYQFEADFSVFFMGISMYTQWREHIQILKGKLFDEEGSHETCTTCNQNSTSVPFFNPGV